MLKEGRRTTTRRFGTNDWNRGTEMLQTEKSTPIAERIGPVAAPSEAASGLTRTELLILLALAAIQFAHIVDFMIVMPLGPDLKTALHLDPRQFSLIVAIYGFSASLSGVLASQFVDRYDRKKAVLWLYAGFTLGTLFCALAPNYELLLAARAVAGGFGGVVAAAVLTIIGDAFPEARRGRAMGVVMSSFSVASIAGVPAGLYLANLLNWRAPFFVLAALSGVVLIAASFVLPSMRGHLSRTSFTVATPWDILLRPVHLRAYLLMTALMVSSFLIVPFFADYLVSNVGVSKAQLPYVYMCGGLATLLTMTWFGQLSDRFGKLPVFRILALLTLIPMALVTNLPATPLLLVLAISTLYMLTTSGRMVPAMALITASAEPRNRGSFLSINGSVQTMAMGLASTLGGRLLGQTEGGQLTGYPLVGLLAMTAVLASIWLAGRLKPAEGGEAATLELAAE
jgi:predicted MFS family arabinose efflux permease